jgi:HK97 gp10 family phage protein
MTFVSAKVVGVASSLAAFEEMKRATKNRIVRKAVTSGTNPMNRAAKASSKFIDRTGLLRKSIGKKVRTYRNSGATIGVIGPRRGFARNRNVLGSWNASTGHRSINQVRINPTHYAHLVEHGHGGPAPAGPKRFLLSSFNASKSSAIADFSSKFSVEVMSEAAKAYAKQRSQNG